MKLMNLVIFLCVFLAISFGVPFILVSFLPLWASIIGSFGISLISGLVLYFVLGYLGKEAQPS